MKISRSTISALPNFRQFAPKIRYQYRLSLAMDLIFLIFHTLQKQKNRIEISSFNYEVVKLIPQIATHYWE